MLSVLKLLFILIPCDCYQRSWHKEYNNYNHPQNEAQNIMVDVINHLGLNLLKIHNENNDNNIAISPYGAASVLIALQEGLRGDAVREIQNAALFPRDVSIIRIGQRDINRRLKSYFIPKEGFLAGLTLSHENVTLNPEYEDVLHFYGYDVDSFNSALYPDPYTTTKPNVEVATTTEKIMTTSVATEIPTTLNNRDVTKVEVETTTISENTKTSEATTGILTTVNNSEAPKVIPESTTTPKTQASTTEMLTTLNYPENTKSTTTQKNVEATTKLVSLTTEAIEQTVKESTTEDRTTEMAKEVTTTTEIETEPTTTVMPVVHDIISDDEIATEYVSTTVTQKSEENETESTTFVEDEITSQLSTQFNTQTTDVTEAKNAESTTISKDEISTVAITDATEQDEKITTETSTKLVETTTFFKTSEDIETTLKSEEESTTTNPKLEVETIPTTMKMTTEPNEFTTETQTGDDIRPIVEITTSSDQDRNTATTLSELTTTQINFSTTTNNVETISTEDSSEIELIESTTKFEPKKLEIFDASDELTEDAIHFPTERFVYVPTIIAEKTTETSSEENLDESQKRDIRSITDYIIARYYDNHHHYHENHYEPQQQLPFLVNGKYKEYNINFMVYDTVLPFTYEPQLNALALSFPLDSTKYYLLLMLPIDETGIDRLICDLKETTNLKHIIQNMKYTHVKTAIPSFMLKGYVNLTPTLQKMGIRNVFEPRRADFSQMTRQKDIYVTNIEQAITVTIKNYVDPNTMQNHRDLFKHGSFEFKIAHPFLYFVMDSELHVALMAGKIVNPLNSRIR